MGVSTVSGPWGRPLAVRIKGFSRGRTRPRRLKRKKGRDARMSLVIAQIINGLQTGSIFALVALGYSMVYGIILLLNFAHGDIIMVGAYMTFYAITTFHLHPLLSVVLAVVVSTLLGVVSLTSSLISMVVTGVLSIIFSIYMLGGREKLLPQCRRLLQAYTRPRTSAAVRTKLAAI